jgi:hypothetical protein
MKTRPRRSIVCICLLAGALPASAVAAEPVLVEPPAPAEAGDVGAAGVSTAGMNSGCRSRNGIEFSERVDSYNVRHFFDHSCTAPVRRSECVARLFEERPDGVREISEIREVGGKTCAEVSNREGPYPLAERQVFLERYIYKLTLKSGYVWGKPPTNYCQRTNERRTLVCSDNFRTRAPNDKTEVHRPQ